MNPLLLFSILVLMTAATAAQEKSKEPLEVVPAVDLSRYTGTWYEIARLPFKYQSQCVGDVTATYTLLDDGTIKVVNRCRKESGEFDEAVGKAKLASADGPNMKLKVRFAPAFLSWLPFVWGDYWMIDLASDYSYVVVGEPDRKYMWILSRTPVMDEATFQGIAGRAKQKGYDLARLIRTQQNRQ
jgi:apolipoprotein D and lipocalin family protein